MPFRFVPLRIITGYSFLQSGLTMNKVFASIKKNDFYGAGISDFGVLYGVPSFIEGMEKDKRKYIIGLSISLEDDIVLYALNEEGYRNLIYVSKLVSENKLDNKSLVSHLKGVAMVLETNHGAFKNIFAEGIDNDYLHYLAKLSSYPDVFYLGLEITTKGEFQVAQNIRKFAKEHSYECIAFPRIQYQEKKDAIILTIVNAIENNEIIDVKEQEGQNCFMAYDFYKKIYTFNEMENTIKLVDSSNFNFHQKRGEIISYPVENSINTLKEAVSDALIKLNINDEAHILRAKNELDVIIKMGYEDYFLIVSDYVRYAKTHDILTGPGRGSAAGSLVAYLLGITEVDPLEYDLQFERFLNIARKTMPDIDVDFMDTKRDDVVQYMREKYGANKVANITTFQTIQAKQSLIDIGKVYNYNKNHIEMLSKSITDKLTLREAYKRLKTFRYYVDSDKYFLEIVSLASKIEGLPRQSGLHAAGIILNKQNIDEVLPVTIDINDNLTSQFEKDYLEEQGFLKMDFLSLKNLTAIDVCIKLINKNHNVNLDFYHIPFNDPDSIKLIASRQTAGLFQLEGAGMRNAIKIINPQSFEDVYTLLALYRPGPMDNIKDYAARKNGKIKVNYLNEDFKKILAPTYGVLIYQEQINKIATVMAGYTLSEANLFRRAVSHKEKEVLEKAEKGFISGAIKNGYNEKDAKKVYNDILKFADYGFNKSHAVVYGIIACRMAYLKEHYPLEFYLSILATSGGASDVKFNEYVSELRKRGLNVFAPDINKSGCEFLIEEGGLLFPINFIKGISDLFASKIVDERLANGPFTDFFDFVKRMYNQGLTDKILEKLINAGTFDKLYPSRATLRATLQYSLQFAELSYDKNGQLILDTTLESQKQYFESSDIPIDNLNEEYAVLGIMLSDNPLRYMQDKLKKEKVYNLVDVKETNRYVNIAGIVSNIHTIKTKKTGKNMAFINIFDEYGEMEVVVFPRTFEESFNLLVKNKILLINGRFEIQEEKESFIAESIRLLEDA